MRLDAEQVSLTIGAWFQRVPAYNKAHARPAYIAVGSACMYYMSSLKSSVRSEAYAGIGLLAASLRLHVSHGEF